MALDRESMTETIHARRSEARFQTLVQNASDVILIARPDTTITYQTPSAMRILGYEPGSLEGMPFTEPGPPRRPGAGTGRVHRAWRSVAAPRSPPSGGSSTRTDRGTTSR